MLGIALVGLVVNLAAGALLHGSRARNLNVEAAFRHVVADVLGSVGVLAAALVILLTGWMAADPLVSILIGVLILGSSWSILRDSTTILLEAAPRDVDTRAVGERLARAPGRGGPPRPAHLDDHVRAFRRSRRTCSLRRGEDCHARRRELETILAREFAIEHTTLQVEHAADPGGLVELGRF